MHSVKLLKPLKLQPETIRNLRPVDLHEVRGGYTTGWPTEARDSNAGDCCASTT